MVYKGYTALVATDLARRTKPASIQPLVPHG